MSSNYPPQSGWGQPPTTPAPKRKRPSVLGLIGIAIVGFVAWGVAATENSDDTRATATTVATAPQVAGGAAAEPVATAEPEQTTATKPKPQYTLAQQNAIASAEQYLEFSAFSRAGLIQQLSSQAGEGYSKADATFAVDHLEVDWNEQAVKSARQYLEMSPFSRAGLIQQLSSQAGEGFTRKQAIYAADHVGLK